MANSPPSTNSTAVLLSRSRPSSSETELMKIGALVSRLMSHYWTADDSEDSRRMQLEDWVGDLREFGSAIVGDACDRWRRLPGGKRPTPGDIRAFAIEERGSGRLSIVETQDVVEARRRRDAERARRDQEMAEKGRAISDGWARDRGYSDFDAYLAAGGSYAKAVASIIANAPARRPA